MRQPELEDQDKCKGFDLLTRAGYSSGTNVVGIFYPKIRFARLPAMLGCAVLGALLAGLYGILHDQITYSISHEYFTRLKFTQFHYADFGLPPRAFVAEIGFLATWWVGFLAGWFIARITVPGLPRAAAFRFSLHGFLIIFAFALAAAFVGYGLSRLRGPDYSSWQDRASTLGILDLSSFVRVAYIHNASYLGGLVGLVVAIIYLRRLRNSEQIR